jgi:hypothetical protein
MTDGPELPGIRAFESAMSAPADLIGLATRHVSETVSTLGQGMTHTLDAIELPGLPPAAQMLPLGFGMPNAAQTKPANKVSDAPVMRTRQPEPYGED